MYVLPSPVHRLRLCVNAEEEKSWEVCLFGDQPGVEMPLRRLNLRIAGATRTLWCAGPEKNWVIVIGPGRLRIHL